MTEAMGALLNALGLPDDGGAEGPEIYHTKCDVGGRWAVEFCYAGAAESVVEKPVVAPVEKVCTAELSVQTEELCAHCAGLGHTALTCPLWPQTESLGVQTPPWCSVCNSLGHATSACPHKHIPPQMAELGTQSEPPCPHCGDLGHLMSECPSRRVCMHCGAFRDAAEECPCRRQPPPRAEAPKHAAFRIGGGFTLGPEVPGLAGGGLDAAAALRSLASARVAGCMGEDGSVVYIGERGGSIGRSGGINDIQGDASHTGASHGRPRSAPPRGGSRAGVEAATAGGRAAPPRSPTPREAVSVLSRMPGPESFRALERERNDVASWGHVVPGARPHGHLVGTFIRGYDEAHRFPSERGARTAFRVFRSRIAPDAACISISPPRSRSSSPQPAKAQQASMPAACTPLSLCKSGSPSPTPSLLPSSPALSLPPPSPAPGGSQARCLERETVAAPTLLADRRVSCALPVQARSSAWYQQLAAMPLEERMKYVAKGAALKEQDNWKLWMKSGNARSEADLLAGADEAVDSPHITLLEAESPTRRER